MKTKIIKGGSSTTRARALTDEQRERKNARDRERRAEAKRAADNAARMVKDDPRVEAKTPEEILSDRVEATGTIETVETPDGGMVAAYAPNDPRHPEYVGTETVDRSALRRMRPTPEDVAARQRYRDERIAILSKPPEGETWTERKARHRELDAVLREGGPHARPMRKRHASGMTGNGLVMVRPND
jgi:hypothetical protein